MNFKIAFAAAAVMFAGFASSAQAVTIDFTALAAGTAVTNQFPGVTVSLSGGVADGPAIVTNVFDGGLALTNSTTSYYPTAYTVNFAFSDAVSDISFVFNNYGDANGSFFSAFSGATLVSTGGLDTIPNYFTVDVAGSGITSLSINNGNSTQWQIGIRSLSFTPVAGAVPEPATWAMMIGGMALVGAAMRRRRTAVRFA